MKKIILLCSNGMSTSMMVAKMKEAAKKIGYDCTIAAYALSAASEVTADADCILIGPQVKHKLGEVQAACPGIPAAPIAGAIVESTGSWAMVAVPLGIVGAVGLVCAVVFMARCGKYAVGAAKAEDAQ